MDDFYTDNELDIYEERPILVNVPKLEYRQLVQFGATAAAEISRLEKELEDARRIIRDLSDKHMEIQKRLEDEDEQT